MPDESIKVDISKILNKIGAFQFGTFKLTSGKFSPYYIDLRIVPSFPDVYQKICSYSAKFIGDEMGEARFQRIAGIPITGIPFASQIAYSLKRPFLYVRKGVPLHGRQKRIEGMLAPGDCVLLIDDLVTTGLSLQKAAKAIAAEGGIVKDAAVIIDREEGGKDRLEKSGIKLHSLLTVREIAQTLYELGTVDSEQLKTILRQIKKE